MRWTASASTSSSSPQLPAGAAGDWHWRSLGADGVLFDQAVGSNPYYRLELPPTALDLIDARHKAPAQTRALELEPGGRAKRAQACLEICAGLIRKVAATVCGKEARTECSILQCNVGSAVAIDSRFPDTRLL